MHKFLALTAGIIFLSASANAEQDVRRLPQYQNIDNDARVSLQKCLDDKTNSIEHCMHKTKKMLKHEKKKLKNAHEHD